MEKPLVGSEAGRSVLTRDTSPTGSGTTSSPSTQSADARPLATRAQPWPDGQVTHAWWTYTALHNTDKPPRGPPRRNNTSVVQVRQHPVRYITPARSCPPVSPLLIPSDGLDLSTCSPAGGYRPPIALRSVNTLISHSPTWSCARLTRSSDSSRMCSEAI